MASLHTHPPAKFEKFEVRRSSPLCELLQGAGSQSPNSGWHPAIQPQYWSPLPHQPNWLQHRPQVDPKQVTPLPQRPSVVLTMPGGIVTVGVGDAVEDVVVLLLLLVVVLVVEGVPGGA